MIKNKSKRYPVALDDLFTEFDEAGYCPTNFCDDPEREAKIWKENLIYELNLILDEKTAIECRAVERFAEKLKTNEDLMIINAFDLSELIDTTLKEFENDN